MITLLIITTSILVGVSVKLHLDKLDLIKELDNVRENHNSRVCALDRELDATKRLWELSVETLKDSQKHFGLLNLKYNLYKKEAEKIHEELKGIVKSLNKKDQKQNDKIVALKLSNESLANAYYTNCRRFDTLNQQVNNLKIKLKKERIKAKQIKYDKQNNTIVDPEYLTDLGEL